MTRGTRRALPLVLLALAGCARRRVPQNRIRASRRFESSLLPRSHKRACALTIMTEAGAAGPGSAFTSMAPSSPGSKPAKRSRFTSPPPWHFLREHPLFSPKVGQLVDLRSGGPATVRIVDRDGNYHFSVATRGLFWPLHRIVSDWGERPVTHPHAGE
ncbi:MAG: hypothetical protein ABI233_04865 [Chthoniobacterales bacterium]